MPHGGGTLKGFKMAGWKYLDLRYMTWNNNCANCGTNTWVQESPAATYYSGRRFYDIRKNITGIWFASGLTFCASCFEEIESTLDLDENET